MAAPRKNPPANAIAETERLASQGYSVIGIARALGVSKGTFKRWCEEDEALIDAFEVGREQERQALHALIVQSAVLNKPANANAMFLLKCRHHYREMDSPSTKVDVNVNAPQNVLVVKDCGTDEEWQAKALAQQRALVLDVAYIAQAPALPIDEPASLPAPVAPANYGPPVFPWQSQPILAPIDAPETSPSTPVAPQAQVWRGNA
jgi:AcrR family transcriptional regulator